jgi:hypothetical protein
MKALQQSQVYPSAPTMAHPMGPANDAVRAPERVPVDMAPVMAALMLVNLTNESLLCISKEFIIGRRGRLRACQDKSVRFRLSGTLHVSSAS